MRVTVARALALLTMLVSIASLLLITFPLLSVAGAPPEQDQNANLSPKGTPAPVGRKNLPHGRKAKPYSRKRVPRKPTDLELAGSAAANLADAAGDLLYNDREYAGAEIQYRQAVGLQPHNPAYNTHLGLALFVQNKFSESEQYFREAVRVAPTNGAYHHFLGKALYHQQKYAEAETQYREASRLVPGSAAYSKDVGAAVAARRNNSSGGENPGVVEPPATKGDFSTPKYAIMTFSAAAEHRDIDLLSQCFDGDSPAEFRKLRERTATQKELNSLATLVQGAQVLDIKGSDDKVLVTVKFKERYEKIVLRKSDGLWKILYFETADQIQQNHPALNKERVRR